MIHVRDIGRHVHCSPEKPRNIKVKGREINQAAKAIVWERNESLTQVVAVGMKKREQV